MNQTKGKQERIKANWIQKTDESKNESKDRFQIKTASSGDKPENLRTVRMRQGVSTKGSPPVEVLAGNTNGVWYQGWSKRVGCVWGFGGSLLFFLFWWSLFVFTLATLANTGAHQIMWQCKQYSKGRLDLPLESHRQLLQSSKLYFLLKKIKIKIRNKISLDTTRHAAQSTTGSQDVWPKITKMYRQGRTMGVRSFKLYYEEALWAMNQAQVPWKNVIMSHKYG